MTPIKVEKKSYLLGDYSINLLNIDKRAKFDRSSVVQIFPPYHHETSDSSD